MKSKKTIISLTEDQIAHIKRWLATHNIKCDGKKPFALLAEPLISNEILRIQLCTPKEYNRLFKYFVRIGWKK